MATLLGVLHKQQTLRRKGLRGLQCRDVLDTIIIVRSIEIDNLKDGNNRSELFFVAIVVATLQRNGDEVTLVFLLTERKVLNGFRLGSLIIAAAVRAITEFSRDLFGEIARVVYNFTFVVVD